MKITSYRGIAAAAALCGICIPRAVMAHGFEGDRFFPPTITTDDPFAVDELSLPTVSVFNNPPASGGTKVREIDLGGELDKEILPGWDLEFSDVFTVLQPKGAMTMDGFQNFDLGSKYELYQNPAHEFIASAGVDWSIGGTGGRSIGADSFSTISPAFFLGKGFGDLPDSVPFLKPFAITTDIAEDFPTEAGDSNALDWGFALEYSLVYLEDNVKDTGLPHPWRDMIPVVEFTATSPENRDGGVTTGTVNPGVLWENRYFQLGAEALIPINSHSGHNVGVIFNVNIFFDDFWPKVFGHPLFDGGTQTAMSEPGGTSAK
ncbi:MAG TPA: hypothetical protein VHY22_07330 [Chthoniobacteraceae bacterium]|jgi:hypothetical protein|nr:hypothetical protein [Chthoniobacteraceae bacterium]